MKREKGFTLIELLVVIAIIAILATLVLIALGDARESARDADRKGAISQIRSASQLYAVESNNSYTGMDNDAIGVPDTVQNKDLDILVNGTGDAFCAVIELSEGRWCTDNTFKVGEPAGESNCAGTNYSCGL
jgi:prepilin-type N-terminal cleavage/methylation domain-containing protein